VVAGAVSPVAVVSSGAPGSTGKVVVAPGCVGTSVSWSSWPTLGGFGISVPSGTNANVISMRSLSKWMLPKSCVTIVGVVASSVGQTATCQVAGLPLQSSPFLKVPTPGTSISSSLSLSPVASANTCRVAFFPAELLRNGWMWITPSAWLWMPSGSVWTCSGSRNASHA
jgi:hypothetical protein